MQLEFNNSYMLLILALLLAVCFCRQILEIASLASALCGSACDRGCGLFHCQCVCCPYADAARRALILYCVLMPVAFNMVYFWHECFSHFDWASSVVLVDFRVRGARYTHAGQAATANSAINATHVDVWQTEIDYMFCVMPFALAASLSCWLWVSVSQGGHGDLTADSPWDDELPKSVVYYEFSYYLETFALNLSMIAVSCSERSVNEVLQATLAVSTAQCAIMFAARFRLDSSIQRAATVVLLLLLAAAALPVWLAMVQQGCVVAELVAAVHALCVLALVCFHFTANGEATASSVLLVRVAVTVAASLTHLAVMIHGRNRAC
jgi:hypothetical protein